MPFLGISTLLYFLASTMRTLLGQRCSIEILAGLSFHDSSLPPVARPDPDLNSTTQHYFVPVTLPMQSVSGEVLCRWMSKPKLVIAQVHSMSS
jgi:hypothetical protein